MPDPSRAELERRIEALASAAERVAERQTEHRSRAQMLDVALQVRGLLDPINPASPDRPTDEGERGEWIERDPRAVAVVDYWRGLYDEQVRRVEKAVIEVEQIAFVEKEGSPAFRLAEAALTALHTSPPEPPTAPYPPAIEERHTTRDTLADQVIERLVVEGGPVGDPDGAVAEQIRQAIREVPG